MPYGSAHEWNSLSLRIAPVSMPLFKALVPAAAILHHEQMEEIARTLDDHTLLNIALTNQGDMLRRLDVFDNKRGAHPHKK